MYTRDSALLRRSARRLLSLAVVALAVLALAAPAQAAQGGPPGNNGTVKIDGLPLDPGPGDNGPGSPDNEPHVDCVFNVDWYGFEAGVESDVEFRVQPPSGPFEPLLGDTVTLDNDDASGGGSAAGADASVEYDLTELLEPYDAHPNQGYHIKLTINTEGSRGADVKHKVFWVGPCEGGGGPPPPNVATPPPGGGTPPPGGAATPPLTGGGTRPPQGVVGQPAVTPPQTSTEASGTGDGTGVLVMVLVVLVGGAGAVLATAPMRRRR